MIAEIISKEIDLHYSPDDGGYYFQDYKADKVSVLYASYAEAHDALKSDSITWETN